MRILKSICYFFRCGWKLYRTDKTLSYFIEKGLESGVESISRGVSDYNFQYDSDFYIDIRFNNGSCMNAWYGSVRGADFARGFFIDGEAVKTWGDSMPSYECIFKLRQAMKKVEPNHAFSTVRTLRNIKRA